MGESVVVHLGNGNWIIVDSCLNQTKDLPASIAYLESLGVDVSTQVKLVVASHWHDDHIRGLADVVEYCRSAKFACSAALRFREFLELVITNGNVKLVEHQPGLKEFRRILQVLDAREAGRSGPDHWAIEGGLLHREADGLRSEVIALSPSAQTVSDANISLAAYLDGVEVIGRLPNPGPNSLSTALLVKSARQHVLLGGDLETGTHERRGWRAVVGSNVLPDSKGCTYKVAHHGAPNADYDGIWSDLLEPNPVSIIAPYGAGPQPRPAAADISRIRQRGSSIYCTTWPVSLPPDSRRGIVSRVLREIPKSHWRVPSLLGQVRVRVHAEGEIEAATIECFDGAQQVA